MNRTAVNQMDRLRLFPTQEEYEKWKQKQGSRRRKINAMRDERYEAKIRKAVKHEE